MLSMCFRYIVDGVETWFTSMPDDSRCGNSGGSGQEAEVSGYVRCRRVLYRSRVFGSGTAEVGVYADELPLTRLPYWPTGWSELSVRPGFWYNAFQPDIADILP